MKKQVIKQIIVLTIACLLLAPFTFAVTSEELSDAKKLIDAKTNCNQLSDDQLEIIGEYEMEQMAPKEEHERMHRMMGIKDGTEEEKQVHISLAKMQYCNKKGSGKTGSSMMNGGMMQGGNEVGSTDDNNIFPDMMSVGLAGMMKENGSIPKELVGILFNSILEKYPYIPLVLGVIALLVVLFLLGLVFLIIYLIIKILRRTKESKKSKESKEKMGKTTKQKH